MESDKLSGSEREAYERVVAETLGTMDTGPLSPLLDGLFLMTIFSRD